jgi:hypothetical protein
MYARVARFEGATGDALRKSADEINASAESGPPEGVPAVGFLMLIDPESGRSVSIALFETEDDRRTGDATLESMNPTPGSGSRTSVENYEVAVDLRP